MAELEDIINEPSEAEKRIKQLSGTVKSTAEERDAAKAQAEASEAKVLEANRERDFYASFAGKLNQPNETKVETQPIAGGSATNQIPNNSGEKSIAEMTQAERRAKLMENEADLQNILSPRQI